MRLCFLADAGSVHSRKWVSYFAEQGEEVHWFSLSPFDRVHDGIACHDVWPGGLHPLGAAISAPFLRTQLYLLRPDVVHVHSVGSYGLLALLAGIRPFVATAWGSDVLIAARSPLRRAVARRVLGAASLVTCDAEHVASELRQLGVPQSRLHQINFGIDVDRFTPEEEPGGFVAPASAPRGKAIREQFALGDGPIIISLRSLEPIYDLATLLKAAPQVIDAIPGTRFLILGRGSQEPLLRELVHRSGLTEQVRFVGAVPNEQLPAYLRAADVYVSTALSDAGIAASTAEAMACGLPAVVTAFGDNSKWVEEGEGGFLVPPGDPKTLAERVLGLLDDPEQRRAFGVHNRRVVTKRNNYRVEMGKMHDLYRSLIPSPLMGEG